MIPKQAVLYEEPKDDYNHLQFTCAGCIFFIHDTNQCELLNPENVTANQGCGLYVGGEPTDSARSKPLHLISAEVAGLDTGPFTCKRCIYFDISSLKGGRFMCGKEVGDFQGDTVHINGCCNAWLDDA
jgi:hypothetical protein